jgi:hypothetical protein
MKWKGSSKKEEKEDIMQNKKEYKNVKNPLRLHSRLNKKIA